MDWECPACTLRNTAAAAVCAACGGKSRAVRAVVPHASSGSRATTTTTTTASASGASSVAEVVAAQQLAQKRCVVLVDLDNWASFFTKLPRPLPSGYFVWGFHGGASHWDSRRRDLARSCAAFGAQLESSRGFLLHPKGGQS